MQHLHTCWILTMYDILLSYSRIYYTFKVKMTVLCVPDIRYSLRKLFDWHLLTPPIYLAPMWWLACWEILPLSIGSCHSCQSSPEVRSWAAFFWSVALCEKRKVTWRVLIIFSFALVVILVSLPVNFHPCGIFSSMPILATFFHILSSNYFFFLLSYASVSLFFSFPLS